MPPDRLPDRGRRPLRPSARLQAASLLDFDIVVVSNGTAPSTPRRTPSRFPTSPQVLHLAPDCVGLPAPDEQYLRRPDQQGLPDG